MRGFVVCTFPKGETSCWRAEIRSLTFSFFCWQQDKSNISMIQIVKCTQYLEECTIQQWTHLSRYMMIRYLGREREVGFMSFWGKICKATLLKRDGASSVFHHFFECSLLQRIFRSNPSFSVPSKLIYTYCNYIITNQIIDANNT